MNGVKRTAQKQDMGAQRNKVGAFRKGSSGNPAGRPKGTPNKITERIRETIHGALDATSGEVAGWMHRLGKKDPKGALQLYAALAEFVLPKLSRIEGRPEVDEVFVIDFRRATPAQEAQREMDAG